MHALHHELMNLLATAVGFFATVTFACGAKDPCAGVVPQSLPIPVTVGAAPFDRTPFETAFSGDATGAITFLVANSNTQTYQAAVYSSQGTLQSVPQAQYAETWGPTLLPQQQGFQILEGDGINVARLSSYSPAGILQSSVPVTTAFEMRPSIVVSGGVLLVAVNGIPNAPRGLTDPWTLTVQRFDAGGLTKSGRIVVSTDPMGQQAIMGFAGAVTVTGWTFVLWSTTTETFPQNVQLQGVWVDPMGVARAPFSLGVSGAGDTLDVEPLADGGVAIAARPNWLHQIRDGSTNPTDVGWLGELPNTRLALVRGGRAHAALPGAPYPTGVFGGGCQESLSITLTSFEGKTCGTVSFPVPLDPGLSCIATLSSLALARDGTVVIRTFEYGSANDGSSRYASVARWWPKMLK
jgi:hypothetical protein